MFCRQNNIFIVRQDINCFGRGSQYGFYDIFGKTASIIGTFLVATTTSLTGNASIGVLSIAILLAVALVFLLLQKDPTKGSTEAATVD